MFAITSADCIIGLSQSSSRLGYFHVKNAGSTFLIKSDIVMVGQENLNLFDL